ncbi:MAG: APC family permease [Bacilli bacterium]
MKENKAGLPLAVSMVIGIVVGSGIFFKSDDVLSKVNGNFSLAIIAWIIGAVAMIFGALVIGTYASKISHANGIIDYYEYTFGKKNKKLGELFGYMIGSYSAILFYPALAAVISWVAGMYTTSLFYNGDVSNHKLTWILATSYLLIIFLIATLSKLLSEYIQVSSTILKLVPITIIVIFGIIIGFDNIDNFSASISKNSSYSFSFTGAVIATAFSFDGWIIATTINDRLKHPKKDLPRALLIGTILIFAMYILYFIGITSIVGVHSIINIKDNAVALAFTNILGKSGSTLILIFIIISCLGTVNGLIIATSRIYYQLAIRGHGLFPHLISKINPHTKTPVISSLIGFIISLFMLFVWYSNYNPNILINKFVDISSLPIVLNYISFSVLYIAAMFQFKDLSLTRRFVFPILALLGASIIIYGGFLDESIFLYLIISFIIILTTLIFFKKT